ncbi:MAG: LPS export ABC transporter periplasmic protein LptC [Gemmatimonadota bacterium]|nr:LPS export ABC transporter periplasmic protein LptC [Gemmatimonadota bacterium]
MIRGWPGSGPSVCRSAILVAALLVACAPEDEPPVALEVLPDGVDMAIIDMDHFLTRTGVRRARLRADTAEFRADGEIHLRPVQLIFYDEQGNELSVVNGDRGVFNEMTEDMVATGSVVALDQRDDQRLVTTHIRYEAEEDRLYGDEPFTLYRDGGDTVLEGSSFETDPGLTSIVMFDSSGRTSQTTRPSPPPPPGEDSSAAADTGSVAPPDSAALALPDSGSVEPPPDTTSVGTAPPDTTSARPDSTSARG